jgi:RNA polymerase sigma factor (sigma-70 family)
MTPQLSEQDFSDALRVVDFYACRFTTNASERAELRSAGNYGVVIAADRFDASKGFKFSTYAAHYVKKYIREELRWLRSPVSLPLNGPIGGGSDTLDIDDFLEILPAIDSDEMGADVDKQAIDAALSKIKPEHARLLRQYYFDCLSLRDIGRLQDLSKEGVRRKLERAKAAFKRALTAAQ